MDRWLVAELTFQPFDGIEFLSQRHVEEESFEETGVNTCHHLRDIQPLMYDNRQKKQQHTQYDIMLVHVQL